MSMYARLYHRHYGVHEPAAKTVEMPCEFSDIYKGEDNIDEEKLIAAMPNGYLPKNIKRCLLVVEDEEGGTGQRGLHIFMNWAKYFDAYVLYISKHEKSLE